VSLWITRDKSACCGSHWSSFLARLPLVKQLVVTVCESNNYFYGQVRPYPTVATLGSCHPQRLDIRGSMDQDTAGCMELLGIFDNSRTTSVKLCSVTLPSKAAWPNLRELALINCFYSHALLDSVSRALRNPLADLHLDNVSDGVVELLPLYLDDTTYCINKLRPLDLGTRLLGPQSTLQLQHKLDVFRDEGVPVGCVVCLDHVSATCLEVLVATRMVIALTRLTTPHNLMLAMASGPVRGMTIDNDPHLDQTTLSTLVPLVASTLNVVFYVGLNSDPRGRAKLLFSLAPRLLLCHFVASDDLREDSTFLATSLLQDPDPSVVWRALGRSCRLELASASLQAAWCLALGAHASEIAVPGPAMASIMLYHYVLRLPQMTSVGNM